LAELTHTTELLGLALCLLIGRATAPLRMTRRAILFGPAA
jgi:hypothetical protein